jgi:hypothetical protein
VASSAEPFLGYLTVFKSRLGLHNLVLGVTTFGHQPDRALRRRIRLVLEQQVALELDDPAYEAVFQYLADKKLVSSTVRSSGRYRGVALSRTDAGIWQGESRREGSITRFPVYQTDIWLAHPDVPSTIGVPTPDNVDEVIEFAFQLHLIDRSKNSWTSNGHLVNGLRGLTTEQIPDPANPFLLGAEAVGLLRSLLEKDGLLLRELMRFLRQYKTIRRDEVAAALPEIAARALDAAITGGASPQEVSRGRRLVSKLSETDANDKSSAPGVLEHRTSPRLEWLTDLGYLSKDGLAKNSFEYLVTDRLESFLQTLDAAVEAGGDWPLAATLSAWRSNDYWDELRGTIPAADERTALRVAYEVLRRPIGPSPLRDVAFIAGLLAPFNDADDVVKRIIELIQAIPGASLSGGRTTRAPENIYMTDEALRVLGST